MIRLKANATLYRLAKEVTDVLFEECSLQYSQQFYGEFDYQAKSWNHPRRVIVQVRRKAGELIPDYLFLVTNMETRPEMVVSLYAKRGTMENYIKECKNGFRMDKVSHKYWMTNAALDCGIVNYWTDDCASWIGVLHGYHYCFTDVDCWFYLIK